jgi:hypothetical protein
LTARTRSAPPPLPAFPRSRSWTCQASCSAWRLLASRRWPRLRRLSLHSAEILGAGVEALARGAWPALEELDLRGNDLSGRLTLDGARRWAPALRWLETLNIKHYWI